MPADLRAWLKSLDRRRFELDGMTVTCWFGAMGDSRRHTVRVHDAEDQVRLEATISGPAITEQMSEQGDDPYLWAWRRNRGNAIVGFRVDNKKRLVAEAVAPKLGLTQEEFQIYLLAVASEADRMEQVLTGRDVQ